MSALELDYRPPNFKTFVGNEAEIASLKTLLKRKQPPHVYLITGPSGTGKTTLARIIRNKLKCSKHDFAELDVGEYGGVDTIREIRKRMAYMPSNGPCRVWLLDECHELSPKAQEALLKGLEDCPEHDFVILATTNPEKLKATLKRRCKIFNLLALDEKIIIDLMKSVIKQEKKTVPKEILKQIAIDSTGSPGIALSILDKIIDMDEDDMLEAAKRHASEKNECIDLCRALIKKTKWVKLAKIIKGIDQEPESLRRAVLGYATSVLLNSGSGGAADVIENFSDNFYDSGKAGLVLACYDSVVS